MSSAFALSGGVGLDCCVAGLVWPSAALADRLDLILAALVAAVALTIEPARLRETAGAWQTYRGPRLTGSSWSLGRWRKVSCSAIGPLAINTVCAVPGWIAQRGRQLIRSPWPTTSFLLATERTISTMT